MHLVKTPQHGGTLFPQMMTGSVMLIARYPRVFVTRMTKLIRSRKFLPLLEYSPRECPNIHGLSMKYGLFTKREIKMAGDWPSSFFLRGYRPRRSRVNLAKRERGQLSSHLDRESLVYKGFVTWLKGKFFLRDKAGNPERVR